MYTIGIDVGGTTIKVGLIESNKIIHKVTLKTNRDSVMSVVSKAIKDLLRETKITIDRVKGISLGCPGLVSNGVVLSSANLNLTNTNLLDEMAKITSLPVIVKNDGDMATLAEYHLGAGVGTKNMIMLTFGTGVGGGVIVDGKLYEGQAGSCELGHIPFEFRGKLCGCGNRGCIERYVSCTALSDLAQEMLKGEDSIIERGDTIMASSIERAYLKGDRVATKIVEEYTDRLVQAFTAYSNIFRPDRIVVGGGLVNAPNIVALAIEKAKAMDFGYTNAPSVDIKLARLGSDAVILAGAVLF